MNPRFCIPSLSIQRGISLIELMIAMVLGLLVVLAAIGIFLSSKQTYLATQSLGRVQEASQIAFELMARDIREAGGNPCDASLVASNIIAGAAAITPTSASWYHSVAQPLHGFEGSDAGAPSHVVGTDVIQLVRSAEDIRSVTEDVVVSAASVKYSPAAPIYASGQAVMICDMKVLGVFRAAGDSSETSGTVSYDTSGGNTCSYFAHPNAGICAGAATAYQFPKFATLSALQGVRWFVRDPDNNAANGYSLYRQVNGDNAEEVVQGVQDMQITYLGDAGYVAANALTSMAAWNKVRAVRIELTMRDSELTGTDRVARQAIERRVEHVVTLRNRVL